MPRCKKRNSHMTENTTPMLSGSPLSAQKTYQKTMPTAADPTAEKPISKAYKGLDTDLARDNLEGDTTAADLQDL